MPLIALLTDTLHNGDIHTTDYGLSAPITRLELGGRAALACSAQGADPRATIRALKALGATHVWLCESVGALSPLLEAGDWLIPDDFIDGTRGQHTTFFSEQAGGYVQQTPPFDPASREALLAGARMAVPRPFTRGVYVCVSSTRLETPAEALFWSRGGAHITGRFLTPALPLARELDLRVAALVTVSRTGGAPGDPLLFSHFEPIVAAALAHLGD